MEEKGGDDDHHEEREAGPDCCKETIPHSLDPPLSCHAAAPPSPTLLPSADTYTAPPSPALLPTSDTYTQLVQEKEKYRLLYEKAIDELDRLKHACSQLVLEKEDYERGMEVKSRLSEKGVAPMEVKHSDDLQHELGHLPHAYSQLVLEKDYERAMEVKSSCEKEEYRLLYEKKVEHLQHEKEEYRLLYEKEVERLHHEFVRLHHANSQLVQEKEEDSYNLRCKLVCVRRQVREFQARYEALVLKIERAEHFHSQQSMAASGSYQDSAATPPVLQVASDSVKDAVIACASELFSRIKKASLPIDLAPHLDLDPKAPGQLIKGALQSFLCRILFTGFEDPFLLAVQADGLPLFEKPAKRRAQFLQLYKRCRDLDARQMLKDDETAAAFASFLEFNESEVCKQLKEKLLIKEGFITAELRSRNTTYYSKFLRLVRAVWMLHKLAFAFEPSAEILRVRQGSVLDEEFMEDVAEYDDDEDDGADSISRSSKKEVRFMCVPGLTVRHTIIRARVFSLEVHYNPSPMIVDR